MTKWQGMGGLSHGSFFLVHDSVDTSKPPGKTRVVPDSLKLSVRKIFTGQAFYYSPNIIWFMMAACSWCIFPYDLKDSATLSSGTASALSLKNALSERLAINFGLALSYIFFWHWALYIKGICIRPFVPNRTYNVRKIVHNVYYTILGLIHWTVVEGSFLYLYRVGKLPYEDASTSTQSLIQTILLSVALPTYRDIHFYIAHRMIHFRCLYKYIHSVHHRNTDTEPFSGLAMHPLEHMYYFTCYGPLLVLPILFPEVARLSPFLVFWMGFHLVISPAGSHSGFEDHFGASTEHYLHHRYGECNYSAGINFDVYFGTYRDTINDSKNMREGDSTKKDAPCPSDSKAVLGFPPEYPGFEMGAFSLICGSFLAFDRGIAKDPTFAAFLVTFGPAIWAFILYSWTGPGYVSWRKMCFAPFDKEHTISLALHLCLGVVLAFLPVTYLVKLVLEG